MTGPERKSAGCDMENLFYGVAALLPRRYDPDVLGDVTFTKASLPEPPEYLSTDRFWMGRVGFHFYNGFPIPKAELFIDKASCRHLGLLILAVLLHPEPTTVEVRLTHPSSQIKQLRIRYPHPVPGDQGLGLVPGHFTYWPDEVYRQPWVRGHTWSDPDPSMLPSVEITTADEVFIKWNAAEMDTVVGFGNATGSAKLAELLLNVSLDSNEVDELHLEGEPGYRGVSVASSELSIYLPGSFGYLT